MKEATESRAFLAWFLENYYHLDEIDIQDSICDRNHDKGIDGIYVNPPFETIEVFQGSIAQNTSGAFLGDVDLKTFQGSLLQFQNSNSIKTLIASRQISPDLKAILEREQIGDKLDSGYKVKGIYITNRTKGSDAIDYLKHNPNIEVWDADKLESDYVPIDKTVPINTPIEFDISNVPCMEYPIGSDLNMAIAPLYASELIKMHGIENGELFAPNVRYWLGKKTTVNKSLIETIQDKPLEHKYFPAFHNGIIVLCKTLKVENGNKITISDYAVVNGCQSLKGLFDNAMGITPDLKIMVKFIQVLSEGDLVKNITYRTNNQNSIRTRDLQSNNHIQLRLQSSIAKTFKMFYRISRGERPDLSSKDVIENTLIGQLLLAFDLSKPSDSHLIDNKIFNTDYGKIFGRKEVDAYRVIALFDLFNVAFESLQSKITDKGFASYTLTRFVFIYFIRRVLESDDFGKKFIENPKEFVDAPKKRKRLLYCISTIANVLAIVLENEFNTRNQGDEFFDYKSELKNENKVEILTGNVLLQYNISRNIGFMKSFSELWKESEKI